MLLGREVWDISECLDGDGIPRLKKKIICPCCGANMDKLWWKEWRLFSFKVNGKMQYRMDIAIKCEKCALVTGQNRIITTHLDGILFGVHLSKDEFEKLHKKGLTYFCYILNGGKHIKLSELYIGGDKDD